MLPVGSPGLHAKQRELPGQAALGGQAMCNVGMVAAATVCL